ncbi:SDR family oxidoreductase [Hyphomicrobium sp.]|uniref:SDR family NAD(P)-dependent oxidoreductase n=1 Tax=Hyphomicrobium sp. TaxID=82 RepID=UPI002E2FB49E|nr:SDR family oxidoreductase [Hyphomicrobium sp.]HEX2840794.1 SDR family oxidoreductase [Hyphomicrobium sp.]
MSRILTSVADLWIGRYAKPNPAAWVQVQALAPAVVVTGASRGIGRALAHRFARAGRDIVLIARVREALDVAARDIARDTGVSVHSVALDVTDQDAPHRLDAALREAGVYADVLVNNAGIGLAGLFADHSQEDLERLIAINITAATRLMRHALAPMLARGRGGILNVGSLGGLVPGPHQAAYYATKAYLISLTEAVAHEVRGRGVRIAIVAPGPVETSFHGAMGAEAALYRTIIPSLTADAVARSAYRGFQVGRTVIIPGVLPSVGALGVKLLPHAITVPLVGRLLALPRPAEQHDAR